MKDSLRALFVALVFMALAIFGLDAPATAAPAKPAPGVSAKASIDAGWTGWTVKFSKSETAAISAGLGSCSVVVGKIKHPAAVILSGACGLLAVWGGYAVSRGRCLGVHVYYTGLVPPPTVSYPKC